MKNIVFISLLFFSSCKIEINMRGGSIPDEAKTVSVAFFENNAPLASPILAQNFTESLKDLFINQTKLNLVQTEGDLQFDGSITGYDIRPIALQGNETASMNRLTIAVRVRYRNTFDEKQNFEQTFTRFTDFPSSTDITSQEETLVGEVNKQLVQDIYDRSFGNW